MCGIAGIWNLPQVGAPLARIDKMLSAMRHRGPDGQGTMQYVGGAAGMVRLALVDLSERGQQPLWSADRQVAILFNGEIYNFREHRQRLLGKGYSFQSTTDTEVILNLYLEEGLDCVQKLRGMFAFAIFDWRRKGKDFPPDLLLGRGPLGIKPLYLFHPEGNTRQVIFASELRTLLASGLLKRSIDPQSVADFFAFGFMVQPRTMISGVRMMEPGSVELYRADEPPMRRRFWHMPAYEPRQESLDEAAERLRAVLEESVRIHAMADAPVGAFLSGGVDSTGITGLMRKFNDNLRTYTLRFPELPDADESNEAAAAARQFGCHHTIIDVASSELVKLLPRFAGELDQPSTDGINTWLVSRGAAQDVKGVLSGLGGDEWFAGYRNTRRMTRYASTMLGKVQAKLGQFAYMLSMTSLSEKMQQRVDALSSRKSPLSTWISPHMVFRYQDACQMAGVAVDNSEIGRMRDILDDIKTDWEGESPIGLSCLLDTRVYMTSQLLRDSDATSMAHSLELRVPLVDVEIANFARSCADNYKLNSDGGKGFRYAHSGAKRVLIHALRDILPAELQNRQKKGFVVPVQEWMRREWRPMLREICNRDVIAARGLVDPEAVMEEWKHADLALPGSLYPKLWSVLILELWCQAVLDTPLPTEDDFAGPVASVS